MYRLMPVLPSPSVFYSCQLEVVHFLFPQLAGKPFACPILLPLDSIVKPFFLFFTTATYSSSRLPQAPDLFPFHLIVLFSSCIAHNIDVYLLKIGFTIKPRFLVSHFLLPNNFLMYPQWETFDRLLQEIHLFTYSSLGGMIVINSAIIRAKKRLANNPNGTMAKVTKEEISIVPP